MSVRGSTLTDMPAVDTPGPATAADQQANPSPRDPRASPSTPRPNGWSSAGTVGAVIVAMICTLVALGTEGQTLEGAGMSAQWRWTIGFVVGPVLAVGLVWRRRFPVQLCLAGSAAALFLPLDSFVALLSLTWVFASAGWRRVWQCTAAAAAATGVALWRDAAREPAHMVMSSTDSVTGELTYGTAALFWFLGILFVAATVGAGLVRRSMSETRRAVADKDAQVARVRGLRDEMTRQEERELIAREVHDTVAHHISLISLQASALEVQRGAAEPVVREAAQQMRSSAQQAIAEMRGLLTTLRSGGEEDPTGPGATLEDLAGLLDNLRRHGRWVTSSVYVSDAHTAAPALTRAVFRIVQEAVTNALKHAPGQPVEVEVRASQQAGVFIRVANVVVAPSPAAGTGSGIIGMRERAERFGGRLDVGMQAQWFVVTARLPWVPASA